VYPDSLNPDPDANLDPALQENPDPDPGFDDQKLKKVQLKKELAFFDPKLLPYLLIPVPL
jgi:hypothetical protein